MLIDNNLIAYEFYKNQYVPKEIYYSGKKKKPNFLTNIIKSQKKELF